MNGAELSHWIKKGLKNWAFQLVELLQPDFLKRCCQVRGVVERRDAWKDDLHGKHFESALILVNYLMEQSR